MRNNKSDYISDWTTAKIKKLALEYHDTIHGKNAVYGCKDVAFLDALLDELEERGYDIGLDF